jgi:Zn-dependent metalloprotease
MADPFFSVRYHVEDEILAQTKAVTGPARSVRRGAGPIALAGRNNDESAARHYLAQVLDRDPRPAVRSLSAPERPEVVPDMRLEDIKEQPLTKTRLVRFGQTRLTVPIFGSRAVVELNQKRGCVSVSAQLSQVDNVAPVPSLSQKDALAKIAELTKVKPVALQKQVRQPAQITYFHDARDGSWHLAYHFKDISALPPDFLKEAANGKGTCHGHAPSPRQDFPVLDYLVDAHDGTVLFYFSKSPMILPVCKCSGKDELNVKQDFWGTKLKRGFELTDPLRRLKTYDLKGADLTRTALPGSPIRNASANFPQTEAVSAHVNAARVHDFYNSVFMRDGVDDKGMDLVSVVNCTYKNTGPSPEWPNAVWWNGRMWYGQVRDAKGKLKSYARYLDVIAHELTHGITESTAGLVYKDEPGALSESLSDIFGVIIGNWYTKGGGGSVRTWRWEFGPGLGEKGLPLRDLSRPERTGDPDHMKKYLKTANDSGGVHTNSNIHNKAAFYLFSAKDKKGKYIFPPRDAAALYYLCLPRLSALAGFSQVLAALLEVARTFYAGVPGGSGPKVKCILAAYKKVGIVP